jgi:GNAT superfamily N-acetyltransferase
MIPNTSYPLVDLELARRLERTEARTNAALVEARALLDPASGAMWTEVAGAYAMFDGVGSPLTQSFGLGLFEAVGAEELARIEAFFAERGAEVFHEVSPLVLAQPPLLDLLDQRGYRPIEFTTMLFRPTGALAGEGAPDESIRVRRIEPGEESVWAEVASQGWGSESAEVAAFVRGLGEVSARARDMHAFLAEQDGRPIASGSLSLGDGVALLAGASTIPAGRRQGAQRALLEARLRFAADQGCALAMMGAAPGSSSQRNAERQGFRIAYTRVKWHRVRASA